jgi:RIO kinase 1
MPKFYNYEDPEMFEEFAAEFDPVNTDRQARRKRNPKARHVPKKSQKQIVETIAAEDNIAGGFKTTYQPSKHEAEWLLQSLETFYYQDMISDVVAVVKGGKEASVYRCKPHNTVLDKEWVAAKVYRPRMFRQLRNDTVYREGRAALGMDGKEINAKDWRTLKAMNKGTGYGQAMSHTSWLMYEYKVLRQLHDDGAAVPEPLAVAENAILMDYVGDENLPAPTLSEVRLQPEEVRPLFNEVMRNLDLMLQHGFIHGDLSAFNILYWEGDIIFIDFPQVVEISNNRHARKILTRDIERVSEYFEGYGMRINANGIARDLWHAYGLPDANPDEALVNRLEAVSFDDYEAREDDD